MRGLWGAIWQSCATERIRNVHVDVLHAQQAGRETSTNVSLAPVLEVEAVMADTTVTVHFAQAAATERKM